jgi:nucleoside 2-deoxyribosyltransferase
MRRPFPYAALPFCPNIVGSSKLIEGDFHDALKLYISDLDENRKGVRTLVSAPAVMPIRRADRKKPVIFLSGPERYSSDATEFYEGAKADCEALGYEAISPLDTFPGLELPDSDDSYEIAAWTFAKNMALLQSADFFVANLEDFHGWEPNNDVSFECGVAYGLGKKCIACMPSTDIMRNRIPHYDEERDFRDWCGNVVENFDYPINLMFSCSMPIVQGGFKDAVAALWSGL